MRIVHVAPDFYPVPPLNYGGIERMIHALVEESVRQGHDVYLYAREGSQTSAQLIPYHHEAGRPEHIAVYVKETLPDEVDVIHDHTHLSVIGRLKLSVPTVCTIHDSLNNEIEHPIYLSKRALEHVGKGYGYFVYNGIDLNEYPFQPIKEDYLLFLGVISAHKGIHHALDIAERTKRRMKIAGPVFNSEYFQTEIEPRIKKLSNVEYVGEVGGEYRLKLLKEAACLVFPTSWEEPFGLVMVEAMACGTPVVALDNGAVSEVLKSFPSQVCQTTDEMIKSLEALQSEPNRLRDYVSDHFTVEHMTEGYLAVYQKVIHKSQERNREKDIVEHLLPAANYFKKTKEFEQAIDLYEKLLNSVEVEDDIKIFICNEVADIYHQLSNDEKEREYCYRSFQYDKPRAEICCRLGYRFLQQNQLEQAVFWYTKATELDKPLEVGMLYYDSCWTWLPHIQLCVCYYQLKNYEKSYDHNEEARKLHPSYEHLDNNKKMLEDKMHNQTTSASQIVTLLNGEGHPFRMDLKIPGFIEETIIKQGNWEPYLVKKLGTFLREGGVFLDIGANIGYHALHAASLYSNVECICFEPHQKIYKQLVRNNELNRFQNLKAHSLAVGDVDGRINFYMQNDSNYNRGMSAVEYYDGIGSDFTEVEVDTITLDTFLSRDIKEEVRLIKIDTQGYELQVIQGALHLIEHAKPVITIEHHNNAKNSIINIKELLPNYKIYRINFWTGKVGPLEVDDSEGFMDDYVFVPKQLVDVFEKN
ncbi:FkbM family methyltransferase [Fictibacillus halophilus]|uniref:FkbM family methyltransferase n=1 Tax=Fictibacillus halophilus TaxID=1610490 RepID=A0ABV2LHT7_9BACL|nr:FkbM family methyltransferase [Fictibacillus halophilus]